MENVWCVGKTAKQQHRAHGTMMGHTEPPSSFCVNLNWSTSFPNQTNHHYTMLLFLSWFILLSFSSSFISPSIHASIVYQSTSFFLYKPFPPSLPPSIYSSSFFSLGASSTVPTSSTTRSSNRAS